MTVKVVIDTSSLINFFRYYYFDKYNGGTHYSKLHDFFASKIKSNEIIVIDKVYKELFGNQEFKREIRPYIVDTTFLLEEVQDLIDRYYLKENEKFVKNDGNQIESILKDAGEKDADLYLIAYCNSLKQKGERVILITDETTNTKYHQKLIQKIPSICRNERIEYRNIPYSLFEIYKNELEFKIEV